MKIFSKLLNLVRRTFTKKTKDEKSKNFEKRMKDIRRNDPFIYK